MVNYGRTWWGEKWLDAVKGVDYTNRIPRGKTYANTGKVFDVNIIDNIITAKVAGNYSPYYKVKVMFKSFNKSEKELIAELINNSSSILSELLNKKLPEDLYYELSKIGIDLFPKSWDDLNADCNCPDYASACKHIASLIYIISLEIDKDPFLVFKLHDCDLFSMVNHFEDIEEEKIRKIKNINEIVTNNKTDDDDVLIDNKNKVLDEIDLSNIPNLHDSTFLMLKDNPVFFDKDFKLILSKSYKSFSKYSKKILKYYPLYGTSYNDFILLKATNPNKHTEFIEKDDNLEEWLDKTFTDKWSNPHLWGDFSINLDDSFKISEILISDDKISNPFTFKNNENLEDILLGFLVEINSSHLDKYNENIQFLHLLSKFTLELVKEQAIIPEIYGTNNKTFFIKWAPALYNKQIANICEKFYLLSPDDLLTFNSSKINKKDQVLSLISILICGILNRYIKHGLSQNLKKQLNNPVFDLFFVNNQKFDDFETKGFELLIDQWLSNLSLKSRDYDLFLHVEENDELFTIDLKASIDDNPPRKVNEIIASKDDYKVNYKKLQLLSDIYLIKEYLPEINESLDFKKDINFNLDDFSKFFINTLPLFEIMGISIILPKSLEKIYNPRLVMDLKTIKKINKNEKAYLSLKDIISFDWKIAIGDKFYTKEEFENLIEKSKGLVKIANDFVIIDKTKIKSFVKKIDKAPKNPSQNDLMQAILSGEFNDIDVNIDQELKSLMDNLKKESNFIVPKSLNADLRDYQELGFSWLSQNIHSGFGSILADDMGLGKTIQVLTTILYLKDNGCLADEKVLVIAPTSLLYNWEREIKKFTPNLISFIYHGTKRRFPKKDYDIVLTSYGLIRQDEEKFKSKKWFLIVVDEAQNIKNPLAKQTKSIKAIKSKHKIALTGTPVENRLSEYWSIFDFTNKNYLNSAKKFSKKFIIPIEKERNHQVLKTFKDITSPFILRRLKTDKDIINDLPDKIVNDVFCNLTLKQSALYQETLNSLMGKIDDEEGIGRKGLIFKLINALKQICNHPSQFTKSKSSQIKDSGKMEVLINVLDNITASGEKVLIFTQYVQMGEIIQKLVEKEFNTEVLFLHGSLTRKKRDKLVNEFQNNSQKKIFIVSLKAGGTGLNLTAAQNVIHYDLWWNPAVENQATDRAYRIGQKENVMVYRFISPGTFEEKINTMIKEKEELADLTVGSGEKFLTEMNNDDIKKMLELRK